MVVSQVAPGRRWASGESSSRDAACTLISMIAAIWLRQFPLQAYLRAHEQSYSDILGMVDSSDHRGSCPIICVSEAAKNAGVRVGMTVAQGHLRAADLRIVGRNERSEVEGQLQLRCQCLIRCLW